MPILSAQGRWSEPKTWGERGGLVGKSSVRFYTFFFGRPPAAGGLCRPQDDGFERMLLCAADPPHTPRTPGLEPKGVAAGGMRDDRLCLMIPFLFMRRTGEIIAWRPARPGPGPTYLPKESSLARFCLSGTRMYACKGWAGQAGGATRQEAGKGEVARQEGVSGEK